MVKKHPIKCPFCSNDTGLTIEGLMYRLIEKDLKCPHCRGVVIRANKVEYEKVYDANKAEYKIS